MAARIPTTAEASDDAAIVRRVLGGDQLAFAQLMRRFNRRLYRLARAIIGNGAEAEDALQEAYLSAFRRLDQFRGESSLATWLSRVVVNECLGRKRRDARRQNVIPLSPVPQQEIAAVESAEIGSPDQAADRAQMKAILERRIDELPETFRAVFVLRSIEELTVEETAACLGIPEETVRSRHFRARTLLREALAREVDLAERNVFDFAGARCARIIAHVQSRLPEGHRETSVAERVGLLGPTGLAPAGPASPGDAVQRG